MKAYVVVFPCELTPDRLVDLAEGRAKAAIDPEAAATCDAQHAALLDRIRNGESLYGITTGFGPLVTASVSAADAGALQTGLIHQLSAHTGPVLPFNLARAVVAVRLSALSKGISGVRGAVLHALAALLNGDVMPQIPWAGSVGASGDLVPLSAVAGVLSGRNPEGITEEGGRARFAAAVHVTPGPKEALALVNGTSFSTAVSVAAVVRLRRLLDRVVTPGALVFMFRTDVSFQHLDAAVYRWKAHPAVTGLAGSVQQWLGGFDAATSPGVPQPPYSSRTFMLWMGSALDRMQRALEQLTIELNSVDDNPLFIDGRVAHAGNFQGVFTAAAADDATAAALMAAQLMERQIYRMLHPAHNGGRPPFLAPGEPGLHSGLQGLQLLATAQLGEIKKHVLIHTGLSHPTNGDNQDLVSMSAAAARSLHEAVALFETILAAWLVVIGRMEQLSPAGGLPPPLRAFLDGFPEVCSADHTTVRYEVLLEAVLIRLRAIASAG